MVINKDNVAFHVRYGGHMSMWGSLVLMWHGIIYWMKK